MEINSRCIRLLKEIANEKSGVPIVVLLSKLNITKRALYYDLTKINGWLGSYSLGSVDVVEKSLVLETHDRQAVIDLIGDFSSYQFSVCERRALEILYMTLDVSPVSIERMQNLFDVSKNTIINDIKECKILLEDYSLKIQAGKRGYSLSGEEIAIRKLIGRQVYYLENSHPKSILLSLIQSSIESLTGNWEIDYRQLVKSGVRDYERSINTYLILSDMDYEIIMILVACIRSLKGCPYIMEEQEKDTLKNTPEYSTVLLIIRKLYDANINLLLDESYYITILFLGIKNFDFNSSAAESSYILQFSADLIHNFERVACVRFEGKQNLLNRLCLHVRPMYYRIKYGIRIQNALLEQIKGMYKTIYDYTRRALEMTGGEICGLILEEELAYLCIYMASYLNDNTVVAMRQNPQVLIICGAGVAASVLLREQLIELLGDFFRYQLVPAPEVAEKNLDDYCMIISTVPMNKNSENIFYTGPILSDESKNKIISFLSRTNVLTPAACEVREILETVKKNVAVPDESKLFNELIRVYIRQNRFHVVPKPVPKLREMLKKNASILISAAKESATAVFEAAGLLDSGAEQQGVYAGEMLYHLQSGNGVCEISPGVALEYCQERGGNGRVELGIVLFPYKPVNFDGRRISILVAISTVDNITHFPLLSEVYRFFEGEGPGARLLREAQRGVDAESLLRLI